MDRLKELLESIIYEDYLKRPQKYIGKLETAHLWMLSSPLRLIAEAKVFREHYASEIQVSPHQYVLRCYGGPLVPTIDRVFTRFLKQQDGRADILDALHRTNTFLMIPPAERGAIWRRCFGRAKGPLLTFLIPCSPTFLDRAVIALKTRTGIWCQSYSQGRSDTDPVLFKHKSTTTGLLTAAALNQDIFRFLPYTPDDVRAFLAEQSLNASIEWHPEDDLLDDTTPMNDFLQRWMFEP